MSAPAFPPVPAGRVHCRVAGVAADGADVDLHPDWTAKAGQAVTIKPLLSPGLVFTGPDESILVDLSTVSGVVDADGYIVHATTLAPVYLVATDAVGLSVTGWLWEASFPFSPLPTVRFAVPAGGVAELTDYVLAPAVDATQTWVEQIPELIELLSGGGAGGGVTDHGALTGLADDDHPQYHNNARGDARYSLTGHNHTGTYAPALGPDDNYVTDAEKAALHTHPAVIAQGATAAAARTAIGAGTSSFSGAYGDLSGKPTLGTAAATAATDYATAAQGAKADTALQPSTGQAINARTGAAYTLVASDAGKLVTLTNAAAITLTVPGNVFTAGQRVDCIVAGAGMVTAVGSSCTVNGTPSLVSRAQWSAFTVLFTSGTTAVLIGDLA